MASAYVLVDTVASLASGFEAFLERFPERVAGRTRVRHGSFDLLLLVRGEDEHDIDRFVDGDLRLAPGIFAVERVRDPDTLRTLHDAIATLG